MQSDQEEGEIPEESDQLEDDSDDDDYIIVAANSYDSDPVPVDPMDKLFYAIRKKNLHQIKMLLDSGVPVDGDNWCIQRPISYAALKGHAEIVKLLLDHGAQVNLPHFECKYQREILEHWTSQTTLKYAMAKGNFECVKLLLDAGAKVENDRKNYSSPLVWQAGLKKSRDAARICRYIVESWGSCTRSKKIELVVALCDALCYGNSITVKTLLELGSDYKLINWPALSLDELYKDGEWVQKFKLLQEYGAGITNIVNENKLFLSAAYPGNLDLVRFFLSLSGIDTKVKNEWNETALKVLIEEYGDDAHKEIELLLEAGGNVNEAFHSAVEKGAYRVAEHAVWNGASSSVAKWQTPLDDDYISKLRQNFGWSKHTNLHKNIIDENITLKDVEMFSKCTPLQKSLLCGHIGICGFIIQNNILHQSDLNSDFKSLREALGKCSYVNPYPENDLKKELLECIDEIEYDMKSLFNLAFIKVSTCIGSTDRESKLAKSGLPKLLIDKLLFKDGLYAYAESTDEDSDS